MPDVTPPCQDCPRRNPYCHDPTVCGPWGAYQEKLARRNAQIEAVAKAKNLMCGYTKERRHYLRNVRKGGVK